MRWLMSLVASSVMLAAPQDDAPLRVLFLGNSYTYYNDLPGMVSALSQKLPGRRIEAKGVTRGGATLADLWELTPAVDTLRSGAWDVVVLQDQSTLGHGYVDGRWAVNDPAGTAKWARFWQAEIERKGAKTLLYLTWARKSRPEFQDALNYAYSEVARDTGAAIAPVGLAWKRLRETAPAVDLFDPDGSHPSPIGTFLNACVFLEALRGSGCRGLSQVPAGVRLSDTDLEALFGAAAQAHEQYKAGALNNLLRPDFGSLRALPAPNGLPAKWSGTWKGVAAVYDGKHTMELVLQEQGKECRGHVSLQNSTSGLAIRYPLSNCKWDGAALSFQTIDPRQMVEEYRAVWVDNKLLGTHLLWGRSPYQRNMGSFELKHDADK